MINAERLLTEFLELVRISSPTRGEKEVAAILREKLEGLGFDVAEDGAGAAIGGNCGNLIANLPGSVPEAPVLLLSAHMDCVEPCRCVQPQVVDGMVRSSGDTVLGADDKAGLAAILEAVRSVRERGIAHGPIQVVFTIAEEGGLNGAKHIDRSRLRADFGYVLDSSGTPGEIIVKAPGQNRISTKIYGRAAHAGIAPEEGVNAIVLAARVISQIPDGRIDEETTANIGIMSGGLATNIVPEAAEIIGETRSCSLSKLEALTEQIVDAFVQGAAARGGRAEVAVSRLYDPYVLTADLPVVKLAKTAVQALGWQPELRATGGGSDANYYNAYGIPCAVLGIGMQKVHTTAEFIKVADLCRTAELVLEIIRQVAEG